MADHSQSFSRLTMLTAAAAILCSGCDVSGLFEPVTLGGPVVINTPPEYANQGFVGVLFVETGPRELLIDSVLEGAPAAEAGIASGDILLAVDDVAVETRSEAREQMSSWVPGQAVDLTLTRDGEEYTTTVVTIKYEKIMELSIRDMRRKAEPRPIKP